MIVDRYLLVGGVTVHVDCSRVLRRPATLDSEAFPERTVVTAHEFGVSCGAAGSRPAARLDGAVNRGWARLACPLAGRPEASSVTVRAASRSSGRPGSFPPCC